MKNNSSSGVEFMISNQLTLLEVYSLLDRSECKVVKRVAEDKPIRKIAPELFISLKTVENHITNIGHELQREGQP